MNSIVRLRSSFLPLTAISVLLVVNSSTAVAAAPNWQIELNWDAPTENVDGSPLTDLGAYRIYYGPSSRNYSYSVDVTDGAAVTKAFTPAQPGSWYVAMTAIDLDDNESAYSNEIVRTAATPPAILSSAVLPSSRSVQVGTTATAFATVINGGQATATGCRIAPATAFNGTFYYRETDPATNAVIGQPNALVDIGAGQFKTFVLGVTPSAAFSTTDVQMTFNCENSNHAPVISGVNTLNLAASNTPVPDMVALAATLTGDGIVDLPSPSRSNAFALASVNVGAAGNITVSADTGSTQLPIALSICETDASGQCLATAGSSVVKYVESGETPTYSVFVAAVDSIPLDAAKNRIYVRFKDDGGVTRGSSSVAVRTLN